MQTRSSEQSGIIAIGIAVALGRAVCLVELHRLSVFGSQIADAMASGTRLCSCTQARKNQYIEEGAKCVSIRMKIKVKNLHMILHVTGG